MTGATATESTRDQIIHAAADSLLENGYSGTSVRSIASKAGVAIGTLQYWFPTKSELLVEAWRYLTATSVEELRRTLNQLTDPLEVLEVGVESLWDSLRRLGDVQLAAFDLLVQAPRTERLRAYLPELFTRYREVIQEQLDRLEEDGRVRLTVPRDVLVPLVPNTVLMGDLCLARGSRLLADNAPLAVQVAFARAIESMSSAAASEQPTPTTRQLLATALGAGTPPGVQVR